MMFDILVKLWAAAVCTAVFLTSAAGADPAIPADWLAEWQNPPALYRPLQMVHGRDLTDPATSAYFRDECGLGGLVVNVGGAGYVRNPDNWKRFAEGARTASDAGLRLWIYDEEGYPSLEAGGAVLELNPDLVSRELVWDKDADEPFTVRDCYEYTHSCNNYAACRRYPNPLEPESAALFLEVTHKRYKEALGEELYNKVEAFFTDEPSMMAANLGLIPEEARKRVPTIDPVDPEKKNLPMLPWCSDLEQKYKERYGEDLRPHFLSLFAGETEADKAVRARYWRLIEDLYAQRYFEAIRTWCRANGKPLSSGHTLHEETLNGHVPLDGNKMRTLKSLDLPGLDELNSDPMAAIYGAWLAAAFPCSAAQIIGERRVMCEMSDHSQVNGPEKRPAPLDSMEAASAWQTAWGVTDFTLYYGITPENADYRNEATHRQYCDFIGRINAILFKAEPVRPILLYYPIETMQREFKPVAECVNNAPQSETMQNAVQSFVAIGTSLFRAGIPFTVLDGESAAELDDSALAQYHAVIFPIGAEPSVETAARLSNTITSGTLLYAAADTPLDTPDAVTAALGTAASPRLAASPRSDAVTQGVFRRGRKLIFQLTNLAGDSWEGTVNTDQAQTSKSWAVLNPQNGEISAVESETGSFPLKLEARQTLLFIAEEASSAQ